MPHYPRRASESGRSRLKFCLCSRNWCWAALWTAFSQHRPPASRGRLPPLSVWPATSASHSNGIPCPVGVGEWSTGWPAHTGCGAAEIYGGSHCNPIVSHWWHMSVGEALEAQQAARWPHRGALDQLKGDQWTQSTIRQVWTHNMAHS